MNSGQKKIDVGKNTCYEKYKRELSTFIIEVNEKPNDERLSRALSLILSEKDVIDFLRLRKHSSSKSPPNK
jgi:hypothetical protein